MGDDGATVAWDVVGDDEPYVEHHAPRGDIWDQHAGGPEARKFISKPGHFHTKARRTKEIFHGKRGAERDTNDRRNGGVEAFARPQGRHGRAWVRRRPARRRRRRRRQIMIPNTAVGAVGAPST